MVKTGKLRRHRLAFRNNVEAVDAKRNEQRSIGQENGQLNHSSRCFGEWAPGAILNCTVL